MARRPRYLALSLVRGRLRLATHDGRPADFLGRKGLAREGKFRAPPVVMIHGFRYHASSLDTDNAHRSTFRHWRTDILSSRHTIGYAWWSCPGGMFSPFRHASSVATAWCHGRYNTYRYAWDLAAAAGWQLVRSIALMEIGKPIDMMAHSLGSRVVLAALRANPDLPVRRVVLLNGAELSRSAHETALLCPKVRFINMMVATDDVLRIFGSLFAPGSLYAPCVGRAGLGEAAPKNWLDVQLDSPALQRWAADHGWPDVQGDNPKCALDHWFSHKHPGNWPLIRAALDGTLPK
jgi:hypothetical protein